MSASRTLLKLSACLSAVLATIAVVGCGDASGLAARYPVTGTVKYKGELVPKGNISFSPDDPATGRAAGGEIKDGSYKLTTANPDDGALPGSYKVTITSVDIDSTKLKEIAKGGQFHHDKSFLEANKSAKQLVPSKYSLADTSKLTAKVEAKSNSIDFDLTD